MDALVRLPSLFLDDHIERDLPSPVVVRRTRRHSFVRLDDPALPELLSDARYYSEAMDDVSLLGLVTSARWTVRAIRKVLR